MSHNGFREVHRIVPPNFNTGKFEHACVVEGEEVLTLRLEEQRSQLLFFDRNVGRR